MEFDTCVGTMNINKTLTMDGFPVERYDEYKVGLVDWADGQVEFQTVKEMREDSRWQVT